MEKGDKQGAVWPMPKFRFEVDLGAEMKKVAFQASGEQKYTAALGYYYLALILMLHEDEIIPYRSSLTNWEYYRKMIALGFPKDLIHGITKDFDDTQYGHKLIQENEFQVFQHRIQQVYVYVSTLVENK